MAWRGGREMGPMAHGYEKGKENGWYVGWFVGWMSGRLDGRIGGTIIGTIGQDDSQCFLAFSDDACWKAGQGSALKMLIF